jgi:hypothetical protein
MIRREDSSFRDPAAFVFSADGIIYRHLQPDYQQAYDHLMSSGLYTTLAHSGMLISHEETNMLSDGAYKVIKPGQIPFINYPYEWSFEQFKAAALLTLKIQQKAMSFGMTLKDATGFNICFEGSHPVFIDTASFDLYDASKPWSAYRQFCQHFLAPLLLARYRGSSLLSLLAQYPDGIPLELAAELLPARSNFSLLSLLHIHLQRKVAATGKNANERSTFSQAKLSRIIEHLQSGISALSLRKETSHWSSYYHETILSDAYLSGKRKAVLDMTDSLPVESVLDLGANTGEFSMEFASQGKRVIAAESDRICVDQIFSRHKKVTAVCVDIIHPSPSIGWMNKERARFSERVKSDLILALALMHHLCIGKNLPFNLLAKGLVELGPWLLIEFVPKSDSKVQLLLHTRADIFDTYTEENFKLSFSQYYTLIQEAALPESDRKLFLFKRK